MALSLLNKLRLRAGESIDTTDPTDPDNPNQAIIDRYKNVPGVNVEKLTEYVNLNIPEPQTIVDAMLLAEAVGYTPEQAKVVGAQWAQESGRGVSTAGADYNYFGVKSHNKAVMKRMSEKYGIDVTKGATVNTGENAADGSNYTENVSFASFKNPIEGFLGKKAFLETNSNYKKALNPENTADEFAQGLQDAGYATDPSYVSSLRSIWNGKMRTTRPTWMEPTRKSNIPQTEWTMTGVQPTEGSRADLVAEETPVAEAVTEAAPVVKTKEPYFTISPIPSDQDLSQLPGGALGNDIVYTPTTSEKFIMNPLQKSAKQGYFGSGQSMFYPSTIQNKNGGAMAKNIPTWNYPSKGAFVKDTTDAPPRIFENGGKWNNFTQKYQEALSDKKNELKYFKAKKDLKKKKGKYSGSDRVAQFLSDYKENNWIDYDPAAVKESAAFVEGDTNPIAYNYDTKEYGVPYWQGAQEAMDATMLGTVLYPELRALNLKAANVGDDVVRAGFGRGGYLNRKYTYGKFIR